MRFYVAITDYDWFTYLAGCDQINEVNFWQPSGSHQFRVLTPGEPFLFKLHSPRNYIVGGGFFSYSTILPASFAWSSFMTKNGAHSEQEMRARIARYRRVPRSHVEDYEIGCILLQSPFFFREDEWIPASDWDPNIVQGRSYDTAEERGQWVWQEVENRLASETIPLLRTSASSRDQAKFGAAQVLLPRLGQASFRVVVTDAYQRRCAFTGSPVLHVLDAAHIRPFKNEGPNDVRNGILLRQDVHTLFDRGYITVTPEHQVEVSRRIKEEFENGHEYYTSHGKAITLPEASNLRPAKEFLTWHNENVYLG